MAYRDVESATSSLKSIYKNTFTKANFDHLIGKDTAIPNVGSLVAGSFLLGGIAANIVVINNTANDSSAGIGTLRGFNWFLLVVAIALVVYGMAPTVSWAIRKIIGWAGKKKDS